jgi:hypothetical protein
MYSSVMLDRLEKSFLKIKISSKTNDGQNAAMKLGQAL